MSLNTSSVNQTIHHIIESRYENDKVNIVINIFIIPNI